MRFLYNKERDREEREHRERKRKAGEKEYMCVGEDVGVKFRKRIQLLT